MAALEDAAEELVVRLKGLDSEIEESQHTLHELRGRVEETADEVGQEWSHLAEAVTSFLGKLRAEQEQLTTEVQEAMRATADARGAVHEDGAAARSGIAEARANLEALSRHATGLEPEVESLIADACEAPAHSLTRRALEVEQQLTHVLDEVRDFMQEEVVVALDQLAQVLRERCRRLRTTLADEGTAKLEGAFDDWETKLDQLEDYVSTQGFQASQSNARAVVDWALSECREACKTHVQGLDALVEGPVQSLRELAAEVQRTGDLLKAQGTGLVSELEGTHGAVASAVSALDRIRDLLASYSFAGV